MPEPAAWGLTPDDLRAIRSILARNPRIHRAILFGSRAKGNFRPGSDVDLALSGTAITHEDIVQTSQALNEEIPLPYRFDVIDLDHLDHQELASHIRRVGQELYAKDPHPNPDAPSVAQEP